MATHTSYNAKQGLYHAGFIIDDDENLGMDLYDEDGIQLLFSQGVEEDWHEVFSVTIPEEKREEFATYLEQLAELLRRKD
jgi:hypothetical protein